jgi:uncharacterized repeat protein (TIGR01451 family)
MKFRKSIGLGVVVAAMVVATPILTSTPVLANILEAGQAIAERLQPQAEMKLELSVAKAIKTEDAQGKVQTTWQDLEGQEVFVQPGDTLQYRLSAHNLSEEAAQNLVLTQPIPAQTTYRLGSAKVADGADAVITYSIDGGESFVAEPTVEVVQPDGSVALEPAPAEAYTHVRWSFAGDVNAEAALQSTYEVQVR